MSIAGSGSTRGRAKTIRVLDNASILLDLLADRGEMGIAEIARDMGVPRPSAYRLVDALEVIGFVTIDDAGAVRLGLELLHLAQAALAQIPELQVAGPVMTRLRDETGQTVYLGAVRGERIMCLDWREGERVSLLVLTPGGTLPPNAGGLSRVIVAHDPELLQRVIASGSLQALTPHTITGADALIADAETTRRRGHSISDEDVTVGVAAIGVPIISPAGRLVGALSVAGLRDEVLDREREFSGLLEGAAREVAASAAP